MRKAIATFFVLLCGTAAYGQFADAIAHTAQSFGQEDDVTVLTLTLAPAEVLHA
jgi:hypothetical protein